MQPVLPSIYKFIEPVRTLLQDCTDVAKTVLPDNAAQSSPTLYEVVFGGRHYQYIPTSLGLRIQYQQSRPFSYDRHLNQGMLLGLQALAYLAGVTIATYHEIKNNQNYKKLAQNAHSQGMLANKVAQLYQYKASTERGEILTAIEKTESLLKQEKVFYMRKLAAQVTLVVSTLIFVETLVLGALPLAIIAAGIAIFAATYLTSDVQWQKNHLCTKAYQIVRNYDELFNRRFEASAQPSVFSALLKQPSNVSVVCGYDSNEDEEGIDRFIGYSPLKISKITTMVIKSPTAS